MTDGSVTQLQRGRRRIIERPRLTRLLDESQARIKMLVAPAGYGKSTLARQWTARGPRAWYRVSAAAADVASVARGVATASAGVAPGCNLRLEERLRITKNPDAEFATLAEILIEDLAGWPSDAWLVLDDAQHVLEKESTSAFVAALVRDSSLNMLLCTRQRPAWITARDLLYGQALELGRNSLAMTHDEAAEVMQDTVATPGVMALADGWPAVVGLASLTPEPTLMASMSAGLPEALYDFLAGELYQTLPPDIQDSMCLIAVAGVRSRRLVERLFPEHDREAALREVIDAGWLTTDADGNLELHPLLEAFLRHKLDEEPTPDTRAKAKLVVETLVAEQHWDEAFGVIERYGFDDQLPPLLRVALEHFLASGRTATLQDWVDYAERRSIRGPERELASAELLFREGRFHESEVRALSAADSLAPKDPWKSRAYARAGRAAHAANREQEAFSHYSAARETASSRAEIDIAALGQLAAAIDLELPEAPKLLAELEPRKDANAESLALYFSRWINLNWRFGTFGDLLEARRVYRLLHSVSNPMIRCSFRNAYGFTVASAGEAEEARAVIASQLDDAATYRLAFAIPYARVIEAVLELLLGRYDRLAELLREVERAGKASGDDLLTANAVAVRTRALVAQGRFKDAVRESLRAVGSVPASIHGELLASRAVALACDQNSDRASTMADAAIGVTRAVETRVCSAVTKAIVATTRADPDAFSLARAALETAREQHCVECFVSGYRGFPELAHLLLRAHETREEMLLVASAADDIDLFPDATQTPDAAGTWEGLSRREQEVLVLVAEGCSNREVARRLYIAEATAKVHVSHILEKLRVSSRTAAALRVPPHARLTRRSAPPPAATEPS